MTLRRPHQRVQLEKCRILLPEQFDHLMEDVTYHGHFGIGETKLGLNVRSDFRRNAVLHVKPVTL